MAKRRKPKATPISESTQAPSSSGPRWMIVSAIRRTVTSSPFFLAEVRNPVIPHISQIQGRITDSTNAGLQPHPVGSYFFSRRGSLQLGLRPPDAARSEDQGPPRHA